MKTIKVSEAQGPVLNWLVAKCNGFGPDNYMRNIDIRSGANGKVVGVMVPISRQYVWWMPSTDWSQGGPLMERDSICVVGWDDNTRQFHAECHKPYANPAPSSGPTQLIAAMRCYVASKLGDEVEVPEELL